MFDFGYYIDDNTVLHRHKRKITQKSHKKYFKKYNYYPFFIVV